MRPFVLTTTLLPMMLLGPLAARATPSTQVWVPSTDIQPFGVFHLNYDVYVHLRDEPTGERKAALVDLGPTVGVLPFKKVQMEVGFDLVFQGVSALDRSPLYFNAKLGTPEDAAFHYSPALVAGFYWLGVSRGLTNQNVGYLLAARTLPIVGRLSAGYYLGNAGVLTDGAGRPAAGGVLLSWDRTLTEISPQLWAAVDYQGGHSTLGALSAGLAWAFSDQVSIIGGYDHFLDHAVSGADTFTVQLDVNIR